MDVAEFLLARIAEDEEAAPGVHGEGCDSRYVTHSGGFPCDCPWPARIAADCESKRQIVKFMQACAGDSRSYMTGEVLRLLAQPYAGHADYQEGLAHQKGQTLLPEVVKVLKVKMDIGFSEPEYDVTELQLWSDGSVTWLRRAASPQYPDHPASIAEDEELMPGLQKLQTSALTDD